MSIENEMYCARHPKEVTGVCCASCGTPICTKCMVSTPVGMKCPTCAKGKNTAITQVRPERAALSMLTAVAAGGVASLISVIGFLMIIASAGFGYFAGSMILKASGMKRGLRMEIITGAGMVLGGVGLQVLRLGTGSLFCIWFWIALGIATSCAVSKIRYM